MAALQNGGAGFRRGRGLSEIRRPVPNCCCCRRRSWSPASPMTASDLGHAGDRRIPGRAIARGRTAAQGPAARAHCRSICGEMHSGFSNLRSALPMNLKAHYPGFKVWAGAQADIERIRPSGATAGGVRRPVSVRRERGMADAMYAPVCTRFLTYDVKLDGCAAYCEAIMALPECRSGSRPPRQNPTRSMNSMSSSNALRHSGLARFSWRPGMTWPPSLNPASRRTA